MQDEVKVREIETVAGDFLTEAGVPFYRVEIDGFCADFDYREAAENFANAINQMVARHRHQAERETLARMERFIEGFCKSLEMGDFANVEGALAERMCCNGQMCGCQGSTVGGYLAYELRSCFKDALPPAPEAGQ